jgi:hypothetical protein
MWWMIGLTAASTLVVLYLFGRRNERAVKRDWQLLLSPTGAKLYDSIEGRVQTELALADVAYDEAVAFREVGSVDDALRLLDTGYQIIERFSPSMMRLLAAMATFSRMVSAMAPVEPLKPKDFRLSQLASLAYLHSFLHHFLVSTSERFRLRVYVLGRSFGVATRYLLGTTHRMLARGGAPSEQEREWEQVEAIRQDFKTLTDESLSSLRILLTSLGAERRDDVLQRLNR